ncbi:MAG: beta-propeller domain-containing protein [Coriobacteriales bacterium]|jgi:uncharacterized secreted protein with C-terminal beta-propeller domain|nr:beta-propeller domain-containing protein [Coriobacteriales bacterium]
MNDEIFRDMRGQMRPGQEAMDRLDAAIGDATADSGHQGPGRPQDVPDARDPGGQYGQHSFEDSSGEPPPAGSDAAAGKEGPPAARRRRLALYLSVAAAFLLVSIAVGLMLTSRPASNSGLLSAGSLLRDAVADVGSVASPADYQELYSVIAGMGEAGGVYALADTAEALGAGEAVSTAAPQAAPSSARDGSEAATNAAAPAPAATADADGGAGAGGGGAAQGSSAGGSQEGATDAAGELDALSSDSSSGATGTYSETNTQVKGIDEGDIVKTDGTHVYALSQNELVIFRAAGADTKELSRTTVAEQGLETYGSPHEMYVSGSTLAIVSYHFGTGASEGPSASGVATILPVQGGMEETRLTLYDVSDPSAPALLAGFGQSGSYQTSRLYGEKLYLVSSYYLPYGADRSKPETFVPLFSENGSYGLMRAADIHVMPVVQQPNYTIVASYDLAACERIDQKSVLGYASTVYMSYRNLYLGSSVYASEEGEPYQESVYTVVDYVNRTTTQLVRVAIEDGALDVAAQCTVEGALLNQFSLDEYEDNLRLVVTRESSSYRFLRDESHDIESYQDHESTTSNAVYVLDPSMTLIGGIEDLAEDERIYSARFAGPVGYMVTYRQVDPLFAIDLADPLRPKVTSELKIPGFSTYLHPFGEGRLLGLGNEAEGAVTQGMKLSMFDVSDPFAVGEAYHQGVDAVASEALYNHKAVLVDVGRGLIGFPGYGSSDALSATRYDSMGRYFVYRYDEAGGFELRAALEMGTDSSYWSGTRGLLIDGYLYVFSGACLDVFDLDTLEKAVSLQVQDSSEAIGSGSAPVRPLSVID